MAGAIDIMVISQPDGSLRSSPFYGIHLLLLVFLHALYQCIHSRLMLLPVSLQALYQCTHSKRMFDVQCALESTLA